MRHPAFLSPGRPFRPRAHAEAGGAGASISPGTGTSRKPQDHAQRDTVNNSERFFPYRAGCGRSPDHWTLASIMWLRILGWGSGNNRIQQVTQMKQNRMMPRAMMLLALIFSILFCSVSAESVVSTDSQLVDDVPEYHGSLGPDSIFYGLKLALENLDEAFTFNETARMEKMMVHAELRISETKTMLKYQQFTFANRAMEAYQEKLNQTSGELNRTAVNETDLVPTQKTMFKYHYIFQNLHSAYPNSSTLAGILNGSMAVQDQFTERTRVKIQVKSVGNNRMEMVKVQGKEKNKPKGGNGSITESPTATPSPEETETAEPTIVQSTETPDDQQPGKGLGRDKDKDKDADGNGKGSGNSDKKG